MSEKSHEETPLCGWAGEYPAAWAALGRSPLPVGLGSFRSGSAALGGWKSRPVSEELRSRRAAPGAQGGAREPRPCPGGAGLSLEPEPPHGRLAHRLRKSTGQAAAFPGIRGRPVRAAHSKFSRAGCRACSRVLEAAAVSRPLPALPRRPLPPLPAARPEFPSPAPAGPSSGHCPRSLRPGHTRPPAGERPAPLGFVPNSASALLPPAPRQSPPSPCLSRQSLPPSAAFISYQLSFLAFLTSSFQTPGEIKTLPFPPKLLPGRPPPPCRRPGSPSRRPRRAPQVSVRFVPPLPPARLPPRCRPILSHPIPSPPGPALFASARRRGTGKGSPAGPPRSRSSPTFSSRLGGGDDDAEREADPPAPPVPAPLPPLRARGWGAGESEGQARSNSARCSLGRKSWS